LGANQFAIASLTCALGAVLLATAERSGEIRYLLEPLVALLGAVAVIFGGIGLARVKKLRSGRGLAIAGMAIGAVYVISSGTQILIWMGFK
jgi:hypothetical protein